MKQLSLRTRVLTGAFSVVAAGAAFAGVATAQASPGERPADRPAAAAPRPGAVVDTTVLSIDTASKAAQAALDAAEKEGQRVTVTVVDRSGVVRVVLKGDGAGPQSPESAERKAFTAVAWNATTSSLAQRVTGDGATLRDIPGTLFLGGGVPVAVNGTPVAGIGVAGAPSGELDEKFAQAGLSAIANDLR